MLFSWPHKRCFLLFALGVLGLVGSVRGDQFGLKAGGEIEGELLNLDEAPRKDYRVGLGDGITMTLSADQVRYHVEPSQAETAYTNLVRGMENTVEAHLELARWSAQNRLQSERKFHLQRVLELDPDHAQARQLLGYQKSGDEWMTREEIMRSRGYQYFEGDWRTPQDIAIRQRQASREAADLEWRQKLRRWHKWLSGRDEQRVQQGIKNLLSATDYYAAPGLTDLLSAERRPSVRKLLVQAVTNNPSGKATATLMDIAVRDNDPALRDIAIDALVARKYPQMVRELAKALKSKNVDEINRAATVLGALEYDDAISPLIDALNTSHKVSVNKPGISAGFSPTRGSGFSFGGGPQTTVVNSKNHEVLNALTALTGKSFDFDERAWRAWHSNRRELAQVNIRRD